MLPQDRRDVYLELVVQSRDHRCFDRPFGGRTWAHAVAAWVRPRADTWVCPYRAGGFRLFEVEKRPGVLSIALQVSSMGLELLQILSVGSDLLQAVPTGFEPAISALTGRHVEPSYTTGPDRQ